MLMRFIVHFLVFPFVLSLSSLAAQELVPAFTVYEKFSELEQRMNEVAENQVLVVNFWATFCKPCVEEMPYFEELQARYADQNVKVLLVSLDFKSQLQKRFIPFLEKNKFSSEIALLADQDADSWIPRINRSWDGAIPVTLVIQGNNKGFHGTFFKNYSELETFVEPFLLNIGACTRFNNRDHNGNTTTIGTGR